MEEWRSIFGQEGRYEVSDHGRVRSLNRVIVTKAGVHKRLRGCVLRPFKGDRYDHRVISFGARDRHYVHTVVLETFIGPCPDGMEGCHNDGVVSNNHLGNLRWDTPSSNQLQRALHGTHHNAAKTHCKHGHEFTPENTYLRDLTGKRGYVNPRPTRVCLACQRRKKHAA